MRRHHDIQKWRPIDLSDGDRTNRIGSNARDAQSYSVRHQLGLEHNRSVTRACTVLEADANCVHERGPRRRLDRIDRGLTPSGRTRCVTARCDQRKAEQQDERVRCFEFHKISLVGSWLSPAASTAPARCHAVGAILESPTHALYSLLYQTWLDLHSVSQQRRAILHLTEGLW